MFSLRLSSLAEEDSVHFLWAGPWAPAFPTASKLLGFQVCCTSKRLTKTFQRSVFFSLWSDPFSHLQRGQPLLTYVGNCCSTSQSIQTQAFSPFAVPEQTFNGIFHYNAECTCQEKKKKRGFSNEIHDFFFFTMLYLGFL